MKLYKLTEGDGKTRGETLWDVGVTHSVESRCEDPRLCSNQVIHACKNKTLAFLLNPIHGRFANPRVYEAEGEVVVEDWDKVGVYELAITKQLSVPEWYKDPREVQVRFAILCAEAVVEYAKGPPQRAIDAAEWWLTDKTGAASDAARDACAAAHATKVAAHVARAAAHVAHVDYAPKAAARAAAHVAYAAYAAACAAAHVDKSIDFGELADRAVALQEE